MSPILDRGRDGEASCGKKRSAAEIPHRDRAGPMHPIDVRQFGERIVEHSFRAR